MIRKDNFHLTGEVLEQRNIPLNGAKTVFHRTPVGIPLLPYAGIKREIGWFDFTIGVVPETIADDCI